MDNAEEMRKNRSYCPGWTWWMRAGERIALGIDLEVIFVPPESLKPPSRKGLLEVLRGLQAGRALVDSMRISGMKIPLEAWHILQTAEFTGSLAEGFKEVAGLLREKTQTRRELAGQLWYPGFVLAVGLGVMGLMLFWVIPQMREISKAMGRGEPLPWISEHIGLLYGFVFMGMLVVVFGALGIILTLRQLARRFEPAGRFSEQLMRRLPGFGPIYHARRESLFLRQTGILLNGGVTLPEALKMAADTVPDKWIHGELMAFRSRLLMGADFGESLAACPLIDRENHPLLLAGQESGKLDTFMRQIADDLASQALWKIQVLTRFLEPAMLFGLSFAIGGLCLAYLLPMVRMLEGAGGAF